MDDVLANVNSAAVWSGLGSWILLGTFMLVQAVVDPPRRWRFAVFAAVSLGRVVLDSLHGQLPIPVYECFRLAWGAGFAGALLWLLGVRPLRVLLATGGLFGLGMMVWFGVDRSVATTTTFPLAFGLMSWAHGRQFLQTRGYSSGALCALAAANALLCSQYYWVARSGDARLITLGYVHMALLTGTATLFGWIHLPRELRGHSPVRVERGHALALLMVVVVCEAAVTLGLVAWFSWPPLLYIIASAVLLTTVLVYFFHHRHRLVIYAENVSALLDERTASLREAQAELSRQNDVQAQRLAEQARDLEAKGVVITRQRRLELAAQTAGQAAHDLQNLIAPVLDQTAALDREAQRHPTLRAAVARLRDRLEQVMDLNAQMLALTRRGRLDLHPVSLRELARETAKWCGTPAPRVECPEDVWVQASWTQLSRALANLVRNAQEAAPARAEQVRIRVASQVVDHPRRCHLGFLQPGSYGILEVSDTGPGIPAPLRERIFEPFFSTKQSGTSGSGLGLAIVAAVVDDHHGVLDLATGSDGTTFAVYLAAIPMPAEGSLDDHLRGSETVLLADDDPIILRQYGSILEDAGYHVLAVRNGAEAIEAIAHSPVDLMVLDLKMPRATGVDVFFQALATRPGTRVVIHSSYVRGEDAESLRSYGVTSLLIKPAGRRELLETVRQELDAVPARKSAAVSH